MLLCRDLGDLGNLEIVHKGEPNHHRLSPSSPAMVYIRVYVGIAEISIYHCIYLHHTNCV